MHALTVLPGTCWQCYWRWCCCDIGLRGQACCDYNSAAFEEILAVGKKVDKFTERS
jgi:hypothetical protein